MTLRIEIPPDAEGRKLFGEALEMVRRDIRTRQQEIDQRADYEKRKWAELELERAKEARLAGRAVGHKEKA